MLEGVDVLLDFDGSSRDRHESFFTSMSFNESVKSVKLTCVVGGDFGESEVSLFSVVPIKFGVKELILYGNTKLKAFQ